MTTPTAAAAANTALHPDSMINSGAPKYTTMVPNDPPRLTIVAVLL